MAYLVTLTVLSSLAAVGLAQNGYNYQVPVKSAAAFSSGVKSSGFSGYQSGASGSTGFSGLVSQGLQGSSGGFGSSGYSGQSILSSSNAGYSGSVGQGSLSSAGYSGSVGQGSLSSAGYSGSTSGSGYATKTNYVNQEPIIHKHVYVHVAPEEPEEQMFKAPPSLPPPVKNYKIIFIKAPSPPSYSRPVIPLQAQNEEKTLVYVLVKKPEDQPDFVIPTPAPTQPSKPEVYFIKYKTQKEQSGGIIANGPIGQSQNEIDSSDSIAVENPIARLQQTRIQPAPKYGPPTI